VAVLVAVILGAGCSRDRWYIQIKGSDTMVNLCQAWAEGFMAKYPDIPVAVTGGGSGTGIAALTLGTCDIANCSRRMEPEEVQLARRNGIEPREFIVALDGIAVVVNPSNPVGQLTLGQLRAIFRGEITNWKQVGGRDEAIVVLSRDVTSGTYLYFKEAVLQGPGGQEEFSPQALMIQSSQAMADEVAQNEAAIGYYGMAYVSPRQKAVAVAKADGEPYVEPTPKNVRNGTYPLARPLYMYTNGEPQGNVKLFIDFVLSPEGQELASKQGFVSVR